MRRADECDDDAYLPGYTHLQRAQPVLLAHHLLAHFWALGPRRRALAGRASTRADVSPLGAGALAGFSLPLDPDHVADALGFAHRFENSLDAVSDRDFVAEALFAAALTPGAPLAHRRGDRALVERGVRLHEAPRRVRDRVVDAAAEEEPGHRRARAREGRPPDRPPHRDARHAEGPPARVQPRPPGGQGAAVRRGRDPRPHAARARAVCSTPRVFDARAHAGRGRRPPHRRPPTSPSTSCGRACRSARPTRWSGRSSASRSSATSRSRSWSRPNRTSAPTRWRCSSPAARCAGARRRAAPGPGRSRAARGRAGPAAPPAAVARRLTRAFYARDSLELAPAPPQQAARPRRAGGAARGPDRRGRGVPRIGRSGQPRVPRPDAAHHGDVRSAGPALRVLHLRHALVRERRRARRRPATRARCCCGPGEPVEGLDVMRRAAARGAAATATCARARPGSRRRSASPSPRTARASCAGPLGIFDDGVAPPARPGRSTRVGLARARATHARGAGSSGDSELVSRGHRPLTLRGLTVRYVTDRRASSASSRR